MSTTTSLAQLVIDSPVGRLRLRAESGWLREIAYCSDPLRENADGDPGQVAVLRETQSQLAEYFAGTRREFELPLRPEGTAFQRDVWAQLSTIPYAETVSYGEIAKRLGMPPGGSRAVGLANGANPISIVVPCHRVIGADGSLTGYAGGLENKRTLLSLEAAHRTDTLF